jgi:tetratricopeptide (TPR) repeat protein
VRTALAAARAGVRAEDQYQVDQELGSLAWVAGDAVASLVVYDSVIAYQSDNPEGLQGRATALALARRWDEAFPAYDAAVRMRTGIVGLRCDYARDLLRAGRVDAARGQLDEAKLLDEENPEAEALRAWADLAAGSLDAARVHAKQALAWGPWSDLAQIIAGAIEARAGNVDGAKAAWAPIEARIARSSAPEYVYRPKLARWERVHALPAVERELLSEFRGR